MGQKPEKRESDIFFDGENWPRMANSTLAYVLILGDISDYGRKKYLDLLIFYID